MVENYYPILMPEKPMNAIAKSPAQINAIGTPCIPFGRSVNSSCSRIPANIHKANVKPNDVENP